MVALVEFSDYECPFCIRHFNETMPLIQKNYAWAAKHAYSAVVSDFTQKMGLGSWTESRPFEPGEIVQTS